MIDKEGTKFEPSKSPLPRNRSFGTFQREFHLADALSFYKSGVDVCVMIVHDQNYIYEVQIKNTSESDLHSCEVSVQHKTIDGRVRS